VDDPHVGALFRLVRLRLGWRQRDVAERAGVSQQLVALVETGLLERLTLQKLRAVAAVLQIRLPLNPRWRGGEADRLLDHDHALIVNAVAGIVRSIGWTVLVEYTFSRYGERGSIDLLAWHPRYRALLIVEVKTRVYDSQDLLITMDRKARLAPELLAQERGWKAQQVGRVLILPATTGNRGLLRRYEHSLGASLPQRTHQVRRWLRDPMGPISGVWFLSETTVVGGKWLSAGRQRVRRPDPRSDIPTH
jgi:transcriptional regulator with XRE-family HTH domain